jgi:hypothetical protein
MKKFKGMDGSNGSEHAQILQMPTIDHEVVNLSGVTGSDTVTPTMDNCRAIYADSEGIIKIGYLDASGTQKTEVMSLQAGSMYPIRNVNLVYGTYNGTNACTAQVYTDAGALVVGVKLRR